MAWVVSVSDNEKQQVVRPDALQLNQLSPPFLVPNFPQAELIMNRKRLILWIAEAS